MSNGAWHLLEAQALFCTLPCKLVHSQSDIVYSWCCSRHSGDKNSTKLGRRISFRLKQILASSHGSQIALLVLVLLMTSMVLGDGVLTPAQSVLGAVYGLQVKTSISQSEFCPWHASLIEIMHLCHNATMQTSFSIDRICDAHGMSVQHSFHPVGASS